MCSMCFSTHNGYDLHGCRKCGKCRSNFQPTYMDVGSAENSGSNFQPTYMDVGSAENSGSNFQPTCMARIVPTILLYILHPWRSDEGNADIASLHGCNLLEQSICPWKDGIRTMHMYRTYGQTFAPAKSALPPSMAVVLGQCICPWMDGSRAMHMSMDGR